MPSVTTKLHVLLIVTILGVGLYMFLLYKEIKMFEREVADLRIKVQSIASALPPSNISNTLDIIGDEHVNPNQHNPADPSNIAVVEDNDDTASENMSVTSNEIKEILTNITDIVDDEHQVTPTPTDTPPAESPAPDSTQPPAAAPIAPIVDNTPPVDLSAMSEQEITAMKYDDLRNILRKRGMNAKGTKAEILSMVLSIKKEL